MDEEGIRDLSPNQLACYSSGRYSYDVLKLELAGKAADGEPFETKELLSEDPEEVGTTFDDILLEESDTGELVERLNDHLDENYR